MSTFKKSHVVNPWKARVRGHFLGYYPTKSQADEIEDLYRLTHPAPPTTPHLRMLPTGEVVEIAYTIRRVK